MGSHELARLLLTFPDLPIALTVFSHLYCSVNHAESHGKLKIGLLHTYRGDRILLGDISKRQINPPNEYVKEMLLGKAPQRWPILQDGKWIFESDQFDV